MIIGNAEVYAAQGDCEVPTTLAAGAAPGESGVSVLRMRFRGGAHFSATTRQHIICFHMSEAVQLECRTADRTLLHQAETGSLAILPAGIDSSADADQSLDALLVSIEPCRFALAAAEDS